jgi:hypothetical protein
MSDAGASNHRPTIAVLGGTGSAGSGLALRWANAGYPIVIGSRNADKAAQICGRINAQLGRTAASHDGYRAAAASGRIVVLSVPYSAQRSTVEEVRDALDGKILIDTTVPLVPPKVARVQLPEGGSAVAAIQASAHSIRRPADCAATVTSAHFLHRSGLDGTTVNRAR